MSPDELPKEYPFFSTDRTRKDSCAGDIPLVVVVQFRGDQLACERIYWDQATVLRQVGLL